jgi:predicted nucleic acid-binding protein
MNTALTGFNTAQIGRLRALLDRNSGLNSLIGDVVRFRVVVDANFVIQDLIQHVRFPARGRTALEELIIATVVDVHAPRWLEAEMASAIPQVAAKRKLSEPQLRRAWTEYARLLRWDETLREPGPEGTGYRDPKDLPYLALEQKLSADGILTKDVDISAMGGHLLTLDFVLSARGYARAAVATVSLRLTGVALTLAALKLCSELVRAAARKVGALPAPVKVALLVGGLFLLVHPGARRWLTERLDALGTVVAPLAAGISEISATVLALHDEAQARAADSLATASGAVRPRTLPTPTAPTIRRRRATRRRMVRRFKVTVQNPTTVGT